MFTWLYEGPVYRFDKLYSSSWRGCTMAPSKEKALNNLMYRFKMEHNMVRNASIRFTNEVILVN